MQGLSSGIYSTEISSTTLYKQFFSVSIHVL